MKLLEETLYGVDTKGGSKVWQVSVEEGAEGFLIRHGKYGGKITEKFTKTEPKNVGKVNATDATEQALVEARARIRKQLDKGYTKSLAETTQVKNPMLAHDYRKNGHRIDYHHPYKVFAQPKLDGVRCLVFLENGVITFRSRGGKNYPVPLHMVRTLERIFSRTPELVIDGELYIHGMPLQDIVSCVKKHNINTQDLQLCVFDIASSDKPYVQRRFDVRSLLRRIVVDGNIFIEVPTYEIASEGQMKTYHNIFTSEGYEGVMIRTGKGLYTYNYRSSDLQKYKEFLDEEFEIVDVEADNEGLGIPVCKTCEGGIFKATFKATREEKLKLLLDKAEIVGKMATIKFQARTKDNIPQFPICLAIRDYE